jgi:hypothetical protein
MIATASLGFFFDAARRFLEDSRRFPNHEILDHGGQVSRTWPGTRTDDPAQA